MAWMELAGAVAVVSALLVLPGLPSALAGGLRGVWLVGAAVPLSATVLTVAAVVAPRLGWDWGLLPVVAVAALLAVAVGVAHAVLRRWWDLGEVVRRGSELVTVAAVALGGAVLSLRLGRALGDPGNVSQTYDSIFHLNAVRWILDTGDASPVSVSDMNSDAPSFYPAGFHAVAALATRLSGVSLPVGVNATWLALAVVVWPLGVLLLTRALAGASRPVLLAAGAVAAGLPAFPYLLVDYGVLYPLLAGYALLPFALATAVRALGVGAIEPGEVRRLRLPWILLTTAALPGLTLMHPSTLVSWFVMSAPWVLLAGWRLARTGRGTVRWVWLVATVGWVGGVVLSVLLVRPEVGARFWEPIGTMGQAVGEVVTLSVEHGSIALVASALTWVGVVHVLARRGPAGEGEPGELQPRRDLEHRLALVAGPVVVGILYVVVAGMTVGRLRDLVAGPWYNNSPRVAALLPVVVVPLAALGAARCWTWLVQRRAASGVATGRRRVVLGLVLLVALTVALQGRAVQNGLKGVVEAYAQTDDPRLLSNDERTLLDRLDETVPEDAVVAGNPWTGTTMAYAIADRKVVFFHILMDVPPDEGLLLAQMRDAVPGGAVCDAVERTQVRFVLDFGPREVQQLGPHVYPGIADLETSDAFELVDQEGEARLFELMACG